jgi:hypothetical protein
MSLENRLKDLATRASTEAKALRTLLNGNAADLSSLSTAAKSSIVASLNELKAQIDAVSAGSGSINDAATGPAETWSSDKISAEIVAAITAVVGGAPGALDTLNEFAAALNDDANFAATVTTELGKRVRVDTATQGLDATQKSNARTNIGAIAASDIGDPETNFVATFEAGLI